MEELKDDTWDNINRGKQLGYPKENLTPRPTKKQSSPKTELGWRIGYDYAAVEGTSLKRAHLNAMIQEESGRYVSDKHPYVTYVGRTTAYTRLHKNAAHVGHGLSPGEITLINIASLRIAKPQLQVCNNNHRNLTDRLGSEST